MYLKKKGEILFENQINLLNSYTKFSLSYLLVSQSNYDDTLTLKLIFERKMCIVDKIILEEIK